MDEKKRKALALERVKGLKIAADINHVSRRWAHLAECNKYHWRY